MKAIIITFDGDIRDEQKLVSGCVGNIHMFTSAKEASVSLLSDKEIADMLTKKVITSKSVNPELNAIRNLCNKIIENVGPIPLRTKEMATREICRFLVSQNSETIAATVIIVAKVDSSPTYQEHRNILQTYGLSFLPQLIRDVNPVFKFY